MAVSFRNDKEKKEQKKLQATTRRPDKIIVSNFLVKQRRGGKGLKRTLSKKSQGIIESLNVNEVFW